jgi:hypothetical protein
LFDEAFAMKQLALNPSGSIAKKSSSVTIGGTLARSQSAISCVSFGLRVVQFAKNASAECPRIPRNVMKNRRSIGTARQ